MGLRQKTKKWMIMTLIMMMAFSPFSFLVQRSAAATSNLNWTVVNQPFSATSSFQDVAYGDGKFIAVGSNGVITSSTDGIKWTGGNAVTSTLLYGVAYGQGVYVAVGNGGAMLRSDDGMAWAEILPSPTNQNLTMVKYINGKFWAVGVSGTVLSSTDGLSWTSSTFSNTSTLIDIDYHGGMYAVGDSNGKLYTSTSGNSNTWGSGQQLSQLQLNYVGELNGKWLVIDANSVVYTSADGSAWTSQPMSKTVMGAAYGNGMYMLYGTTGYGYTSTDASTWMEVDLGSTSAMQGIAYGDGKFVLAGNNGYIMRSTDGTNWNTVTPIINHVIFQNGTYFAVGNNGGGKGVILASADGSNWTTRATVAGSLTGVSYGNGVYVAAGPVGTLYTSTDGFNWVSVTNGATTTLNSVRYVNNRFIGVGGSEAYVVSTDGITWASESHAVFSGNLFSTAYGNGKYVITGSNSSIYYSVDAANWTKVTVGSGITFQDVIYEGGQFVAAGSNGSIYTSIDGVNWGTAKNSESGKTFFRLSYANNLYVAVGAGGYIKTSTDGDAWVAEQSNTTFPLRAVPYNGTRFLAIGQFLTTVAAPYGGTVAELQAAVADGAAGTTTSTKIDLTFDEDVAGLTASDITLTDGTGAAVTGALTGTGKNWSIMLSSVTTEGNVSVAVASPSGYTISGSPVTVAVYKAASAAQEATPTSTIDYMDETLTGLVAGADYNIGNTTVAADTNGEITIDASWLGTTIDIVKVGNGTSSVDSAAQTLTIPARASAPTGVGSTNETYAGANDGTITGVTSSMEYKSASGSWQDGTGATITGQAPGSYTVRTKATGSSFASEATTVTIGYAYAPADDETGVDVNTDLVLTFTESVTAVAGKDIVLKSAADDSIVETIAATDSTKVSITGAIVTITPSTTLLYSSDYYVQIDAGAFVDTDNADYAGIADETTWNFQTEMRSEVTAADSAAFRAYLANSYVDTINLAGGTTYAYDGGTIGRDITVNGNGATIQAGAGVDDTIVRSDDITVSSSALGNYSGKTFLRVEGANSMLTLNNATLENGSYPLFAVINIKTGGSLSLDGVTIAGFHNNPTPGNNLSFGVHAEPGAVSTTIHNSVFGSSNAFRNAVAIRKGAMDISGNTFEGTDYPERLRQSDGYEYAMYIYGGNGTITQNTISGYDSSTQQGYASSGISVIGFYSTDVAITDNSLSYNESGIDVTRTWSPWSSNTTMVVNGESLTDTDSAYEIGEAIRAANQQDYVSVSLDQNDEVALSNTSTPLYFAVLGGYRSPYLTTSDLTGNSVKVHFPSGTGNTDVLNKAEAIELEQQMDSGTTWTTVTPTWTGVPTTVTLSLQEGHTYRFRAKLTHKSYVEPGDLIERTLITYSSPVSVTTTVSSPETTPTATIDYTDEKLTGLVANADYKISNVTLTSDSYGEIALDASWLSTTLDIVKVGNGTSSVDSAAQSLVIPSRASAPTGVGKTDETYPNANDGTITGVTSAMEYKSASGSWQDGTGTTITGQAPGVYTVRTKATSTSFASESTTVTIDSTSATPETTPTAAIDYTDEKLTGLVANADYKIGNTTVAADTNGEIALDASWLGTTLDIVKVGNGTSSVDSAAQSLVIPSRASAPTGVGKTDETYPNANDGTITGVTSVMEYKSASGSWQDGTGANITGQAPGVYTIRTKATSTSFASESTTVTIGSTSATPEATPTAAIDYTDEKLTGLVANADYKIGNVTLTSDSYGEIALDASWLGTTLDIVKVGNGTSSVDSAAQSLVIPSRASAPTGVGKTDETYPNANDGTITGVTSAMEYKSASGSWQDGTGANITGQAPGVYTIRTKATSTSFASESTTVTIGSTSATPEATPTAAIDYTDEKLTGLVANADYKIGNVTLTSDSYGEIALDASWLGTTLDIVKVGNGTSSVDSAAQSLVIPPRPAAAQVAADDFANLIAGLDSTMEYAIDGGAYVKYNSTNMPDLSGAHTVKVRVAATTSTLAGLETILTYTQNPYAGGLTVTAQDPSGSANDGKTRLTVSPAVTSGHKLVYRNVGSGTVAIPRTGEVAAGYSDLPSDGLISAAHQDRILIVEVDGQGRVVAFGQATAIVAAEPTQSWQPPTQSYNPTQPSNEPTASEQDVIVLVNGKVENAGKATTTESEGLKTTLVAVDSAKLQAKLDQEGDHAIITIPVNVASQIIVSELTGQMIKNMENKSASLVLRTDKATYTLPAHEIDIDQVAGKLGKEIKLEDIHVQITIAETPAEMVQVVANAATGQSFTLVVPSMDFKVTATYGGRKIEVTTFNSYVERMIALPAGVDPNKITTGIVVSPDGSVRHVPTKIVEVDGVYYARINSLSNSTYSVVWHPMTFADVEHHWAKDAVNDMGSRMVVKGVSEGRYNPNADITRAEYAAIVVRGLGLQPHEGDNLFLDVANDAWYTEMVKTAAAYGLITGFEDGTFRPDERITREQAVVIIARAMAVTRLDKQTAVGDTATTLAAFADRALASNWAKDSLSLAIRAGVVSGRAGDLLDPQARVTRAEVAVLIQRLLQRSDLI